MVLFHVFCKQGEYLFVPQFTIPVANFIWTFDGERKNLSFCCFIREDILEQKEKRKKKNKENNDNVTSR